VPTTPVKREVDKAKDKVKTEVKKRTGINVPSVPSGPITGIPNSPF
jgi:IMP dehydrogenase/GMP reductase